MFSITKHSANRIDIQLSGKLSSDQMTAALDDLDRLTEGMEQGQMLYDIVDFSFPSLGALAVEFSRLPQVFRVTRRFRQAAVLADQEWLKKASEIEGALIPGLEIRAFDRAQRQAAEDWLNASQPR